MTRREPPALLPRTAAALCAFVAVTGWGYLARPSWSHMSAAPIGPDAHVNGASIGLAAVATPWLMYLAAAVAFVPYGFRVLRTPYWPIAAANLCYFAFAMLVHSARRSQHS